MTDTIKAYAINTIKLGSDTVVASTRDRPSVFDVDAATFARLEKLQAVRKANKEEIAVWQSQQEVDNGTTVAELQTETGERKPAAVVQPESGAANDPKNKPAGKKAAEAPEVAEKVEETPTDELGV